MCGRWPKAPVILQTNTEAQRLDIYWNYLKSDSDVLFPACNQFILDKSEAQDPSNANFQGQWGGPCPTLVQETVFCTVSLSNTNIVAMQRYYRKKNEFLQMLTLDIKQD